MKQYRVSSIFVKLRFMIRNIVMMRIGKSFLVVQNRDVY